MTDTNIAIYPANATDARSRSRESLLALSCKKEKNQRLKALPTAIVALEQHSPTIEIMLTKEITPIIAPDKKRVVGVLVEYKLFCILLYRKRMYTPNHYGLADWEFDYRI